jgi:glycosyltransferase involved in cell wall biosynthesis
MKIAINCCYYGRTSGGIREYIYNLVTNLANINKEDNYIFYVSKDDEKFWQGTMPEYLRYKIFPFNRNHKIRRALFERKFWKNEQEFEKYEVFHSPFFHVPKISGCKIIMTVHDLRFRRYPRSYTFTRRTFIKYAFRKSLNYVDHIITVSEFTKKEILDFYNFDQNKITYIHEAIDMNRFKSHGELNENDINKFKIQPKKYILSVGHLEPRKNFLMLINAWDELKNEKKLDYKLVIVGKRNYKFNSIIKKVKQSKTVIYLDYVSFYDLLNLYKLAKLFIFPSLYEGFGFPPLEAAVFGVPSVVSDVASIPEICGKGALYFNPYDKEEIKEKILQLLTDEDLYNHYKLKAKKNLERFSWVNNAKKTREIYNTVINDE